MFSDPPYMSKMPKCAIFGPFLSFHLKYTPKVGVHRKNLLSGNVVQTFFGGLYICWTARSMERPIFFFLKSHISAPGAQNSPIFFPSWSFPITFTCHNWFWSHLGPLHGRNWKNVSKKCFLGCPRFWVPPGIGCVCEQMVEMTVRFKFFLGPYICWQ